MCSLVLALTVEETEARGSPRTSVQLRVSVAAGVLGEVPSTCLPHPHHFLPSSDFLVASLGSLKFCLHLLLP